MAESHRLPLTLCPWCGYKLDAATNMTGEGGPEPGDLTLCFKCASPLQFDADMRLAKITNGKLREHLNAETYAKFMQARRLLLSVDRSEVGKGRGDG